MASKKYAGIKKLPRLDEHEPKYRERVNAAKQDILQQAPESIVKPSIAASLYRQLRALKDELDDKLSDVNLQLAAVKELLIDAYEASDMTSLTLETGDAIRVQEEPTAKVLDHEVFRTWCIEQGLERSLSLPWQITNAITKTALIEGRPEPDGVQAYMRKTVVLQKGKS